MATSCNLASRAARITFSLLILMALGHGAAQAAPDRLAVADSLWQAEARPAAFAQLDSLVVDAQAEADTVLLITGLTRRGMCLKQDDRPGEAETDLRTALDLVAALGDSARACAPRRWLGVALTAQGRNEEAAAEYQRLAGLAMAVGDTEHAAWAAVGLGWDADLRRDHNGARQSYGQAASLFASIDDAEGELWAQLGEANAWFHLGQYETASRGWDRVARLARTTGLARHEAITRNNIAGLQFALGRPDISRLHYERAVAIWDSLGQQWERVPPVLNLGSCLALLGQVDQARDLFHREIAACRTAGFVDYEARAMRKLADLERDQGELEAAATHYRQVLDLGDDRPVLERVDTLLGLASLEVTAGDHVAALAWLAQADALLIDDHTSQARVRVDLARSRSLAAGSRWAEAGQLLDQVDTLLGEARARFGLELELLRADLHEGQGEAVKGRSALERAAEIWDQERGLPLDPDWRAERGAAGREVFVRLARYLARDEGCAAAFDRLQRAKARTLQEQVRGPGLTEGSLAGSEPVKVAELQSGVLVTGDVLLDAHLSLRGGVLFAVTADTCRMVDLPADRDLAHRLRIWRQLLADPQAAMSVIADSAATLQADLLGPVAPLVSSATRVFFSPDGELNLVPLAEVGPYGDRPWLMVPSASFWRDLQGMDRDATPASSTLQVMLPAENSSRALSGSSWQAEHLSSTYANVAVQSGAIEGTVLADLDAGVLHVGAHVRADPDNAWQSAILLDDGPEGELRAATVAASSVNTPLVVLASCSSGAGRVLAGEGVQGLGHAFLVAGARTVVATLWPVDDDQTALFMSRFYAHLAAGEAVGQAVAATRGELRADPRTTHPFAWAGYVVLGDGELRVPLRQAEVKGRWGQSAWLAVPIALVILFGIGMPRWRRRKMD
jgi:tetratricopeptide (TPR) repeat protein|nr:CHAT domain-containing tetratricopeptide repeat protein [Candidatus Krumholzibacteria bacterium]